MNRVIHTSQSHSNWNKNILNRGCFAGVYLLTSCIASSHRRVPPGTSYYSSIRPLSLVDNDRFSVKERKPSNYLKQIFWILLWIKHSWNHRAWIMMRLKTSYSMLVISFLHIHFLCSSCNPALNINGTYTCRLGFLWWRVFATSQQEVVSLFWLGRLRL